MKLSISYILIYLLLYYKTFVMIYIILYYFYLFVIFAIFQLWRISNNAV